MYTIICYVIKLTNNKYEHAKKVTELPIVRQLWNMPYIGSVLDILKEANDSYGTRYFP